MNSTGKLRLSGVPSKRWDFFLIALFPALSLCLFVPVGIFLANREEFDIALTALMPWFAGKQCGVGVDAGASCAPGRFGYGGRRLASVMFMLGVLFLGSGCVPDA